MATVPIVTEVTKAQLDALVADNGLNEGLQYNVTDLQYRILAISSNTYIYVNSVPYKTLVGLISQDGTNAPTIVELENTLGVYTSHYNDVGDFTIRIPYTEKNVYVAFTKATAHTNFVEMYYLGEGESINFLTRNGSGSFENSILSSMPFEIRVYEPKV